MPCSFHALLIPQILDRDAREGVGEMLPEQIFLASLMGDVFNLKRVGNLQGGVSEPQTLREPLHNVDCRGKELESNDCVNIEVPSHNKDGNREEEKGNGDVNVEVGRIRI